MLVSTHYMDEAERCHDIAYIAYGELLARGTADEVIAAAQACSPGAAKVPASTGWRPNCSRTRRSRWRRRSASRSTSAAATAAALERALAPYRRPPFRWTQTEPTLEDVFIQLMGGVEDNFQ